MTSQNKLLMFVLIYILFFFAVSQVKGKEVYIRESPQEKFITVDSFTAEITQYTSSPLETDSEPNITANGESTGPGTIACPSRFKFGTIIQIEKRIFKCNDRMNVRYRNSDHFDIWTSNRTDALRFGRQKLQVFVLEKKISTELAEK